MCRRASAALLINVLLVILRHGPALNLGLAWWVARKHQQSSCLSLPIVLGLQLCVTTPSFLHGSPGLYACIASPLAGWAIYLLLNFKILFYMLKNFILRVSCLQSFINSTYSCFSITFFCMYFTTFVYLRILFFVTNSYASWVALGLIFLHFLSMGILWTSRSRWNLV